MIAGTSLIATQLPKAQFRAVILCGYGVELYPLIEATHASSSHGDDNGAQGPNGARKGQTKALLPVAGRRMVDWVIDRVEEAGVFGAFSFSHQFVKCGAAGADLLTIAAPSTDVLLLSPESIGDQLLQHIRQRRTAAMSSGASNRARLDVELVPDEVSNGNSGAVGVLIWAINKRFVKSDFVLLPCDLLLSPTSTSPSPITLASLVDRHRADDNLLTTLFYERASSNVAEAKKDGPAELLTIYDGKTSTLLDVRELDEYDDEVPVRTSLLSKFPSPHLSTTLLPTQISIISSSLLHLLSSPLHARRLSSFENLRELIAWIARLDWRKSGSEGLQSTLDQDPEKGLAMGRSSTQSAAPGTTKGRRAKDDSTEGSRANTGANTPALGSMRPSLRSEVSDWGESIRRGEMERERGPRGGVKIMLWKKEHGWCGRGNTVEGWVEMNRAALPLLPPQAAPTSTPSGVFISPDSHLHPSVYTNLAEKVGLKRCIVGKGSAIGKNSKLTNCVLMEGVVVGEGCKLDNCVVSNGVKIWDRAQLKDCEIGRDVVVLADAQIKGEQLVLDEE